MYGLFQTAFYFGYMAVFSLSLGILCGTIGYMGTRWVAVPNLAVKQRPEIRMKTLLLSVVILLWAAFCIFRVFIGVQGRSAVVSVRPRRSKMSYSDQYK